MAQGWCAQGDELPACGILPAIDLTAPGGHIHRPTQDSSFFIRLIRLAGFTGLAGFAAGE